MSEIPMIRERVRLALLVAASALSVMVLLPFSKVSVDWYSFRLLLYIPFALYAVSLVCTWRNMPHIAVACEAIGAAIGFVVPALIATYLALSLDRPMADDALIAMDAALGFDEAAWMSLVFWVNESPLLEQALDFSYGSFSIQLIAIPFLLVCARMPERAIAFVAGYGILCFISAAVAIPFPALGTFSVYGVSPEDVANINSKFGFFFLSDFLALREATHFVISVDSVAGIVTFPSVHAGVAFLAIWAMWASPVLRWPFLILNLLMATAAITHANHYLVDVIAGLGIAGISAAIVSRFILGIGFEGFGRSQPVLSAS